MSSDHNNTLRATLEINRNLCNSSKKYKFQLSTLDTKK